jgi:hypothetical protein
VRNLLSAELDVWYILALVLDDCEIDWCYAGQSFCARVQQRPVFFVSQIVGLRAGTQASTMIDPYEDMDCSTLASTLIAIISLPLDGAIQIKL